jgi:hypothetical protein
MHKEADGLKFTADTRRLVTTKNASPFLTVDNRPPPDPDQSTPHLEITVHHLIPKWFAKKYLHLNAPALYLPSLPNGQQVPFSPENIRTQTVHDWLRSVNNAVHIDQDSHRERHDLDNSDYEEYLRGDH